MFLNINDLIKQVMAQQKMGMGQPPAGLGQPPTGISDPNPQQFPGGSGGQFQAGPYTQLAQQMSGMFGAPQGQPPGGIGGPQPPGVRIPGNPMGPGIFGGQGNYRNDQFGGYLGGRRGNFGPARLY